MSQKTAPWVEVGVTVPEDLADPVSNFLTEHGAQGIYEEYLEPQDGADFRDAKTTSVVKAHFPQDARLGHRLSALDTYIESLSELFPEYPPIVYATQVINDADWAEGWKKYFKPIRATANIIVKPTWERYTPVGHDIVIEVDPGMAFGTGQHASTRMCLEALETVLLQEKGGNRWEVLDIGSGTGILGIAAAKLGAEKVLCVDIDTQATLIARDNIRINLVESQVEAVTQDVAQLHRPFHLIVANLTANPLIQLRPHILSLLVPGGFLIISGIVEQSRGDIETHFISEPLVPLRTLVEKEWLCYLFRKEADPR